MKRSHLLFPAILLTIALSGCKTLTINPLRMTYTYPPAEACSYQTKTACGAIALWNDKTIQLYLPYYNASFDSKPQMFAFEATDDTNVNWLGKITNVKACAKKNISAHFILDSNDKAAIKEANNQYQPQRGMLVIKFPADQNCYKKLAGKSIWLTSSVGWDNVKTTYMIWQSDANLPKSVGVRFSKE